MIELPDAYQQQMKQLLGADYNDYLATFDRPVHTGIRINPLKLQAEVFEKMNLFDKKKIPYVANGFYYEGSAAKHPYYYAGLYYIQEPSAMTPAHILPISPNDNVLDLCAAPGGKTTQLAGKMNGTGILYSNDISVSRAAALLKNVELHGIRNCYVCAENPVNLVPHFTDFFDKILVDAPCSGEGMFHKEPSLIKSYLNKGPKEYAKLQKEIISAAAKMLKPGGMMLYSTCTFSPLEDEETISYLLTEFPEISLVSIKMEEGFKEGLAPFKSCVRLYPHQIEGEGHFVALLQKKPVSDPPFMMKELHTNGTRRKNASLQIPKTVLNELYYFCKDLLNQKLSDSLHSENLFMKEQMIYLLPEESSPVPGIRYLRTGLLVGEIGKNHKFFPSQAFAMTLSQNDYRYVFDLKLDDPAVIKYLKGESIQLPDSYAKIKEPILITVDGYSLGWGLSNHGLLKNKYAKGWRMQ